MQEDLEFFESYRIPLRNSLISILEGTGVDHPGRANGVCSRGLVGMTTEEVPGVKNTQNY
jgi:hypothetical protein